MGLWRGGTDGQKLNAVAQVVVVVVLLTTIRRYCSHKNSSCHNVVSGLKIGSNNSGVEEIENRGKKHEIT